MVRLQRSLDPGTPLNTQSLMTIHLATLYYIQIIRKDQKDPPKQKQPL